MTVKPINGSPTQFFVSSRSLQCPRCTRRFDERQRVKRNLELGDGCPDCGTALAQVLPYQVDLAETFPIGRCPCVDGVNKNATARKLTQAARLELDDEQQDKLRCRHLRAARSFCLNREMSHFEKDRLKNGNGRKEHDAP